MDGHKLFNQHLDQIYAMASRQVSRWIGSLRNTDLGNSLSVEDVVQDVVMAVWKKSGTYDPARCASFCTFAYLVIQGALSSIVRRSFRRVSCHERWFAERLAHPVSNARLGRKDIDEDRPVSESAECLLGVLLDVPADLAATLAAQYPADRALTATRVRTAICRYLGWTRDRFQAVASEIGACCSLSGSVEFHAHQGSVSHVLGC